MTVSVRKGVSVLITTAGIGKNRLGTALGHQACMNGMKVAYYNIYWLFEGIALARVSSTSIAPLPSWPKRVC